jgi:hypothetical protein
MGTCIEKLTFTWITKDDSTKLCTIQGPIFIQYFSTEIFHNRSMRCTSRHDNFSGNNIRIDNDGTEFFELFGDCAFSCCDTSGEPYCNCICSNMLPRYIQTSKRKRLIEGKLQ